MSAIQFITLIRLPFARGDFVDPPQADWNATKDRALWKVISKSPRTSDLNWADLAARFQVPQAFLLQQAAWLYERHLEHVRTQMKKVGSANPPAASGSGSSNTVVGGVPMQRGGSHGSRASRTPSALSIRPRDGPVPKAETSTPVSAFAPQMPSLSRTPSTNTITQSKAHVQANQNRTQTVSAARPSFTGTRPSIPARTPSHDQKQDVDDNSPGSSALSSSTSSSDSEEAPIHRSQLFKRPPRFQKQRPRDLPSYDEDPDEGDDAERSDDISLPFAQPQLTTPASGGHAPESYEPDPSKPSRVGRSNMNHDRASTAERADASSSLASSASDAPKPSRVGPGPISPRHRAELARLSPRRSRKDGSEGTPSMGSSFSDLDDASISQSALEEALLSNMHAGRMSTFSQLRSRYL